MGREHFMTVIEDFKRNAFFKNYKRNQPDGYFSSSSGRVRDPKSETQAEDFPIFRCSRADMDNEPAAGPNVGALATPGRSFGLGPNSILFYSLKVFV